MFKIDKSSVQFQMGIDTPQQLKEWLTANSSIKGMAFVGRSNVGKSTLLNSMFGRKQAKTSKTPGRTQQINVFTFSLASDQDDEVIEPIYLFDLPGYGHANVSKLMGRLWNELMQKFFAMIPGSILLLNLQDARHPDEKADQAFASYMKKIPIDTFLILNKMDKLKNQKQRAGLKKMTNDLLVKYKWVKEVHQVSANKKSGIEQLEQSIINFLLHVS